MTREELIQSLTLLKEQARNSGANIFVWDINIDSFNYVMDSAIQALEQEPTAKNDLGVEVLDKIRAEIEELDRFYDNDYFSGNRDSMFKCNEVMEILNKYKADRSVEDGKV